MPSGPVILITGGAGFIGTNLADRLLIQGRSVRILDDLSRPGVELNLRHLERRHGSQLQVELGDITDRDAMYRAVRGTGWAFHLAGQVSASASLEDPETDRRVNLFGTELLLAAAKTLSPPPTVVFASTNKVYGDLGPTHVAETGLRYEPADPQVRMGGVAESAPLDPMTPYGQSKRAAEERVIALARAGRVPAVVFRMSCIYGPHQLGNEGQGWVSHFMIRALEGNPPTIFGSGRQVRDLLFIDDLVEAFLKLLNSDGSQSGEVFNLGGGPQSARSLLEVWRAIEEKVPLDMSPRFAAERPGDQRWYVTDSKRFRARTGWIPKVSLGEGLEALQSFLRAESTQLGLGLADRPLQSGHVTQGQGNRDQSSEREAGEAYHPQRH